MKIEFIGLKTPLISPDDNIIGVLLNSLKINDVRVQSGDIIVISSKVVALTQGDFLSLKNITPSALAKELSLKSELDPRFVEVIINRSDVVLGAVQGAILTIIDDMLLANAGADQSNVGIGDEYVILLPSNTRYTAISFQQAFMPIQVAIIICDSSTRAMRRGTTGIALTTVGIPSVIDDRGKEDLFGRELRVTTRALADNITAGAQIVMGESNERTPFCLIRGLKEHVLNHQEGEKSFERIPIELCMFMGNLQYENLKEKY